MQKSNAQTDQIFTLNVKRIIHQSREFLFQAWTVPDILMVWFGPPGITCFKAEIDLQVNGKYRLGNRNPDGSVIWITGRYLTIEKPDLLKFSWGLEPGESTEIVTVEFKELNETTTEIQITHEKIPGQNILLQHENGWLGCLQKLSSIE